MKLALLVALALDRRSGRVLGDVMPADQALAAAKGAIASGRAPDPTLPNLGVFVLDSCLRQHRFKPTAEEIAAFGSPVEVAEGEDEIAAILAANEKMQAEINDAKASFQPMLDELERTRAANTALKSEADKVPLIVADLADARSTIDKALKAHGELLAANEALQSRVSELEAQSAEKGPKKK